MTKSPAAAQKPALKKTEPAKKDNYAVHVVLFTVTLLVFSLWLYFFLHSKTATGSKQEYQELPQIIMQSDVDVVRMKVTLEVGEDDQEWLKKNQAAISAIAERTANAIDPETFRTAAGRVAAQEKLRNEINKQMGVNKIKDVLYNDLLIQSRADQ